MTQTTHSESQTHTLFSRVLGGAIGFIMFVLLGVLAFVLLSQLQPQPKVKAPQKMTLQVDTREVKLRPITLYLHGYGTAQAAQILSIVPQVTGKVREAVEPFKPGKYVPKGTLLLRVDPSDYWLRYRRLKVQIKHLKSQIKAAEKAFQLSQRSYQRSRRLWRRRAISREAYERARRTLLDRQQRLAALRQTLSVSQVQLREAALQLKRTRIRAPFHSRIREGSVREGTFVRAGQKVGSIEEIGSIEIPVGFSVEKLHSITDTTGQSVPLRNLPEYFHKLPAVEVMAAGKAWRGRVVRVGANVDEATRTLLLYVKVDLEKLGEIGNLLPGMFCRVKIPSRRIPRAIRLPRQALYEQSKVYVVEQGKLKARQVKLARVGQQRVVVTGGLQDGDLVVVSNLKAPTEGTKVTVRNTPPARDEKLRQVGAQ